MTGQSRRKIVELISVVLAILAWILPDINIELKVVISLCLLGIFLILLIEPGNQTKQQVLKSTRSHLEDEQRHNSWHKTNQSKPVQSNSRKTSALARLRLLYFLFSPIYGAILSVVFAGISYWLFNDRGMKIELPAVVIGGLTHGIVIGIPLSVCGFIQSDWWDSDGPPIPVLCGLIMFFQFIYIIVALFDPQPETTFFQILNALGIISTWPLMMFAIPAIEHWGGFQVFLVGLFLFPILYPVIYLGAHIAPYFVFGSIAKGSNG